MLHFFPKQLHSHKTIPALRTTASKTKVDFDMNNIAKKQFLLCALQRRKRKLILICFTHTTFTTRYVLLACYYLAEGKWFTFIIHLIPSNNFYQSINNILIFNTWSNITISWQRVWTVPMDTQFGVRICPLGNVLLHGGCGHKFLTQIFCRMKREVFPQ